MSIYITHSSTKLEYSVIKNEFCMSIYLQQLNMVEINVHGPSFSLYQKYMYAMLMNCGGSTQLIMIIRNS